MIREGTTARNLEALLPAITSTNSRRAFFVTDDRHPLDLRDDGHIDAVVRRAIGFGLDPMLAIQMASLNTAEYFRLEHRGAVAPGYLADMVVFDDLKSLNIRQVYKEGDLVAENGNPVDSEYSLDVDSRHESARPGEASPCDRDCAGSDLYQSSYYIAAVSGWVS